MLKPTSDNTVVVAQLQASIFGFLFSMTADEARRKLFWVFDIFIDFAKGLITQWLDKMKVPVAERDEKVVLKDTPDRWFDHKFPSKKSKKPFKIPVPLVGVKKKIAQGEQVQKNDKKGILSSTMPVQLTSTED